MEEGKKINVLVVEDDLFMAELLVHELTGGGFEVRSAKTGAEGVQMFQQLKPDIMLLDILLPDQNGFDTLRQVRRLPGGPETKVIILSNLSSEPDIEEAKRLGAVNYFIKANLNLSEIAQKVNEALAA